MSCLAAHHNQVHPAPRRCVVWRRADESGVAEIVPLVPFEAMPATAVDLSKMREELEEYSGWTDW